MRKLQGIIIVLFLSSCHFTVKVVEKYQQYYDDATYKTIQKGLDAYTKKNYKLADSILTIAINNSKDNLSVTMPEEFNPYYYRANNNMELGKYDLAISDMEHVASDTTTNIPILTFRAEAYKMVKQYDTSISICSRLLSYKYDSMAILSERGVCYYLKGEMDKAWNDLNYCKQLGGDTSYLNSFLKKCH